MLVTRKEKRKLENGINYFFELLKIQMHFFKDFKKMLKTVKDPRHPSYITYGTDVLLFTLWVKNIAGLSSMRDMTNQLNADQCIENIRIALGLETLEELPHYDTINHFLAGLELSELEEIRTYMMRELFKKRCFEAYRIKKKYWGVIVDGTGLHTFREKHCEHCLRRVYTDEETGEKKTIYMHHVLEAKLVVGDMVFSMASEFIENESEDVTKQDCELKAFKRLAAKLKTRYKRLPICLIADSLYACEPVFKLCEQYKWHYLLRLKEARIKSVSNEFKALKVVGKCVKQGDKHIDYSWVNDIAYNSRTVHVMEAKIVGEDGEAISSFQFISDLRVKEKNIEELILFGRRRWKIENEGFNHQKNGRYQIEHINSYQYQAMKNHYLMVQITDIMMQLYDHGVTIFQTCNKTVKEKSSNLLQAILTRELTVEDIKSLGKRTQVRFP